jgi:hypothetical protein
VLSTRAMRAVRKCLPGFFILVYGVSTAEFPVGADK